MSEISLTFGEVATEVIEEEIKKDLPETLTPEEQKMVDDFSKQINLQDSNGIMQYGVGTQKKMSSFSEDTLKTIRSKDLGEVGNLLTGVVTEIKSFDEEEKGILGLFKKAANKLQMLQTKYNKVSVNIDKICDQLEGHKITLMKDINTLDKMYELKLQYYKELNMYILAGKAKIDEVLTIELPQLREKAKASRAPEDAQMVNDLESQCSRFEKKLHDLELTKTIAMQTAPQIRMVQNNDIMMSEKVQTIIINTIPLWKNQMVLALGIENSKRAMEDARKVTDATNELLKKNADAIKQSSVEIAKESERGIVDIETLEHTNKALISTIDEVMQIQKDGKDKRREVEERLQVIESELKTKLLENSSS
ncbi:MAG: toxic anion resistance protein [Suipraeoptans sp.]